MNNFDRGLQANVTASTRRTLLKNLTCLLGAAGAIQLTAGSALSIAASYSPQYAGAMSAGKIFTLQSMKALREICALVIPATDTASAADVDVHGFIDNQLFHCHSDVEQKQAKAVLEKIESVAMVSHQSTFLACSFEQQVALLNAIDQGEKPFDKRAMEGFRLLKGLIVFGYFSSEAGATRALRYQAIPGGFKGSIPYKVGDRSWGSIARF